MQFQVKICGLRDAPMLDAAIAAGAGMVGFVHFPRSPRHVTLDIAAELGARARGRVQSVVLVVDPDDALLADIERIVAPDWIQAHGKETPARIAAIRAGAKARIIKAVGVSAQADVDAALAYDADLLLLDAQPPRDASRPGGNGVAFDWALALDGRLPPFILSGGLAPTNVAAALGQLQSQPSLAGVDVSSGVESEPGVKDAALIEAFVRAAHAARLT